MIPVIVLLQAFLGCFCAGAPELTPTVLAISYYESGQVSWDPAILGDGGCSVGRMQMYTCGGLGDNHPREWLKDPIYNYWAAASYIKDKLNKGYSLYSAISPWNVRYLAWWLIVETEEWDYWGELMKTYPELIDLAIGQKSGIIF